MTLWQIILGGLICYAVVMTVILVGRDFFQYYDKKLEDMNNGFEKKK